MPQLTLQFRQRRGHFVNIDWQFFCQDLEHSACHAPLPLVRLAGALGLLAVSGDRSRSRKASKASDTVPTFNLYDAGLSQLGSAPGRKWIDLSTLASWYASWRGAPVQRVVYRTARVNDPVDPIQTQGRKLATSNVKAELLAMSVGAHCILPYPPFERPHLLQAAHPYSLNLAVERTPRIIKWDTPLA